MDNKKSEGKDDPPSSPTILNRHGKPAMETKNGVIWIMGYELLKLGPMKSPFHWGPVQKSVFAMSVDIGQNKLLKDWYDSRGGASCKNSITEKILNGFFTNGYLEQWVWLGIGFNGLHKHVTFPKHELINKKIRSALWAAFLAFRKDLNFDQDLQNSHLPEPDAEARVQEHMVDKTSPSPMYPVIGVEGECSTLTMHGSDEVSEESCHEADFGAELSANSNKHSILTVPETSFSSTPKPTSHYGLSASASSNGEFQFQQSHTSHHLPSTAPVYQHDSSGLLQESPKVHQLHGPQYSSSISPQQFQAVQHQHDQQKPYHYCDPQYPSSTVPYQQLHSGQVRQEQLKPYQHHDSSQYPSSTAPCQQFQPPLNTKDHGQLSEPESSMLNDNRQLRPLASTHWQGQDMPLKTKQQPMISQIHQLNITSPKDNPQQPSLRGGLDISHSSDTDEEDERRAQELEVEINKVNRKIASIQEAVKNYVMDSEL